MHLQYHWSRPGSQILPIGPSTILRPSESPSPVSSVLPWPSGSRDRMVRASSTSYVRTSLTAIWYRDFRRDRTTTEGTRSERTKPLPSDHGPACSSHHGFLHYDLHWVRILPSPGDSVGSISIFYPSVEVTLGGWIVTYIIKIRGGGPSSGYISSGFFGGLTVGRVGLLWINKLVGERRAVFLYGALTIVYGKKHVLLLGADIKFLLRLEIIIWKVPSLVGNAVTVSFVGVLVSSLCLTSHYRAVGDFRP